MIVRRTLVLVSLLLSSASCQDETVTAPSDPVAFAPGGRGGPSRLPISMRIADVSGPGLSGDDPAGVATYTDQACGVYAWFGDGLSFMNPTADRIALGDLEACGDGRWAIGHLDGLDQELVNIKLRVDDWDNPTRATATVNLRTSCVFTRGARTTGKGLRFDSQEYAGSTDIFFQKTGDSIRFYTSDVENGMLRNHGWCEDDHPDSPRILTFDFDVTVTRLQ